MNDIRSRIQVGPDHRITGTAPAELPPGEYEATIAVTLPLTAKRFRLADLPVHGTPWDGSISLHREDMYGDNGR